MTIVMDVIILQKYFWKPDVFFRNQRASDKRGSATDEALLRVNSSGHMWFVTS